MDRCDNDDDRDDEGDRDQAEAEQQALAELEAETVYFCDFADRWLDSLTVEKSTHSCYLGATEEVWKPHFRDRPVGSIRPSEIMAIVAELARRVTGKTVNNSLIPLRGVFAAALDDEIIDRAPTLNIKSLKHQAPKPDPFRVEEMDAIIGASTIAMTRSSPTGTSSRSAQWLRPSEQIVVRWSDIDWNGQTIRIERARVRAVVKSTKTSSIRDVDLTDRTLGVLDRQRSYSLMKDADAPIFENPSSRLPWPDVQDQRKPYFHPTLLRLGLRRRDAYQIRRTFATLALMAGVNPAYIARQLGHANTAMLFKHYSRSIDGADAGREKSKLNGVFGPKLDQKVSILPGVSQSFGVLGSEGSEKFGEARW
ncbi:tyrosine-type recombinase/integrase [Sphingomonas chungangi]